MAVESGRAAIWEVDLASGAHRVFAAGLRNPNGMPWEPLSGTLLTAVNERDELGSDLLPDYMTTVRDGGFYGWPFSYYGDIVDERVRPGKTRHGGRRTGARLCAGATYRIAGPGGSCRIACLHASRKACSWGSTAPGIGARTAATK